jgi:hypothetical protein
MRIQSFFTAVVLAFFAACSLSSCEEIVDADGLPYEEKLVVHSILFADSSNNIVQISRTLPLNVVFDSNQAYIKDAAATISDGTSTFPLEYTGSGGKYRIVGLTPQAGNTYHLSIDWKQLHAKATTTIPIGGSIDSAWLASDTVEHDYIMDNLVAITTLPEGSSMRLGYSSVREKPYLEMHNGISYGAFRRKDDRGKTVAKLNLFFTQSGSNLDGLKSFSARAFIFAPGYYEYTESKNAETDESLGNPVLIKWNVSGDAIGIFFGCKVIEKKLR